MESSRTGEWLSNSISFNFGTNNILIKPSKLLTGLKGMGGVRVSTDAWTRVQWGWEKSLKVATCFVCTSMNKFCFVCKAYQAMRNLAVSLDNNELPEDLYAKFRRSGSKDLATFRVLIFMRNLSAHGLYVRSGT